LYCAPVTILGASGTKCPLDGKFATLLEYGILASARDPFDPMEKAFHALGALHRPAEHSPHNGRTLKWEYGLRPDLLAVTHVYELAGSPELIVAAKGAPEAIAELCHLSERDRAELRRGVDEMAQEGMRVLVVARASVPVWHPRRSPHSVFRSLLRHRWAYLPSEPG